MSSISKNIGLVISEARKQAVTQINTIMVKAYWEIGKMIVEEEQGGDSKAEYGKGLLKGLSKELSKEHGKGFSKRNLEQFRKFYIEFQKTQTLSAQLGWSHYTLLLRIDDKLRRDFYIKEIESQNWSVRELKRQIDSALFERIALSRDKQGVMNLSKNGLVIESGKDLIKDPYIFEFLGLESFEKLSESDFESKLIENLEKFILELGKGFSFVSRQERITLDGTYFYIDLVFYNRFLKSFVIFELKVGELKHEHLGQLQMYVNYYDRKVKSSEENKTVGILLCLDKKDSVVKYTLPLENTQLFASRYELYLPDKKELEDKVKELIG
jgi:predicted nuclease of restriction endonuclease-like (RecB) superfamily